MYLKLRAFKKNEAILNKIVFKKGAFTKRTGN